MIDKGEARKAAFAARKAAFAAGQGQAAELLADFLAAYQGKALAGYMAMRTEIDPLAAMVAHQGPVCVPVIIANGQPLKFREWSPGCRMEMGAFGAEIPAEGAWIEPEVLIVPLVGFDARGYRLGYGGGFYDRTLEGLRAKRPTFAVGFAFDAQEMPEVPIDQFDQRLDAMVTESGLRLF
ncbi:MAG: 5-formyltetrahydrofolate cyclo-ligase [Rhodobacterales bacterium RIFCSPHIGHO2_02_FULL_62_130]|jgi:5-formyltetrahydrofolate cyclo-ligase|nr:MAG: 5-formyltetrahydrofolate cyclo-ligase [Rhodobacterales bacterium RIFCSPHIGHO2_02_FULL_62_130]OHC57179.1 MAG: 5-formyltetrahydrofolate cyclo-ligase [Rhodobacterales bacterium RIFCSPHIGHO2_12_FULL_62_75]HCZ01320.1 5-formyltetrahydrofolate cyclo-ligase [Rhodobacter sp.]